MISGAISRIQSHGYCPEPFFINPGEDVERSLSRILWSRGIRGVIITPLEQPQHQFKLEWHRFCAVAIGHSLKEPLLHRAVSHQFQTITEATDQLLQLGYRRIGCCMPGYSDSRTNYTYRAGYYAMRSKYGAKAILPLNMHDDHKPDVFYKWFERTKPDVILGLGAHAHVIIPWLNKIGLNCPQNVGYATVHLTTFDGSISGIKQNSAQVGAAAVDLLVSTMRHNETGIPMIAQNVMINGTWYAGQTTRRQN